MIIAHKNNPLPVARAAQIQTFRSTIGSYGWFIGGSFAHPHIKFPNNINMYFTSLRAYTHALEKITKVPNYLHRYETPQINVFEYMNNHTASNYNVIFIMHKKDFGEPKDIFATMDISLCKVAVTSSNMWLRDSSATRNIEIFKYSSRVYERIFALLPSLPKEDRVKALIPIIDKNIGNYDLLPSYYAAFTLSNEHDRRVINNFNMYHTFKHISAILPYLQDAAAKHAPELLI